MLSGSACRYVFLMPSVSALRLFNVVRFSMWLRLLLSDSACRYFYLMLSGSACRCVYLMLSGSGLRLFRGLLSFREEKPYIVYKLIVLE